MLHWTVNLVQVHCSIHLYQFNCNYATNYLYSRVKDTDKSISLERRKKKNQQLHCGILIPRFGAETGEENPDQDANFKKISKD